MRRSERRRMTRNKMHPEKWIAVNELFRWMASNNSFGRNNLRFFPLDNFFFFFQFLEKKEDFDEISPEILAARYDRRNIRATPKSLRRRTTSIRTSLRSSPKILRTNSSIPPKRRNDFVFFFFPLLLDGRLHPLLHARLALHTG